MAVLYLKPHYNERHSYEVELYIKQKKKKTFCYLQMQIVSFFVIFHIIRADS